MDTRKTRVELSGEQRADGSYHLKSDDLPGFHFIVGPDEKQADFEAALSDALLAFIPRYADAKARQRYAASDLKITRSRPRMNFTAELQLA